MSGWGCVDMESRIYTNTGQTVTCTVLQSFRGEQKIYTVAIMRHFYLVLGSYKRAGECSGRACLHEGPFSNSGWEALGHMDGDLIIRLRQPVIIISKH